MDKNNLGNALETLNPENDSHWTADGAPKLEALETIVGEKVKRAEVTKLFPLFTREVSVEKAKVVKAEAEIKLEKAAEAPVVKEDVGEALYEAVDIAENKLNDARKDLDTAIIALGKAQENYADMLKARDDAFPPMTNTQNIREFLDEQHRQRIARHIHSDAFIRKADAAYLAKAPVDKAFAAKRSRGTRRPVHPRVARQG